MQRTMLSKQRYRALIILMLCAVCTLGIATLPHLAWAADDANSNQTDQATTLASSEGGQADATANQGVAAQGQNVDSADTVTTPEPSGTTDPSDSASDPKPVDTPAGGDDPEPVTQEPVEGDEPQEPSTESPQGTATQVNPEAKADPTPAAPAPATTATTASTPKAATTASATTTTANASTTTAKTAAKGSSLSAQGDPPGKVLADGVYFIESARNLTVVLDMSGADKKKGGNAIVWTASRDANQQWKLVYDAKTGCYTIMNVNSNLFLGVAEASKKSGANVLQWTKTVTGEQLWHIFGNDTTGYTIASHLLATDALVLSTAATTAAKGNNVCVKTAKSDKSQLWYFLPITPKVAASDEAAIKALGSGKVYTIALSSNTGVLFDIAGCSQNAGANTDLWSSNGGSNQKFVLVKDSAGYYSIVSVNSGQALDVSGESPVACANVLQWTQKNAANQRWAIRALGGNKYKFISKLSGMAMAATKAASGANLQVYLDRNAPTQTFVLKETSFITDGIYSVDMRKSINQVLDVPGENMNNNVQVGTWSYNTGLNEKFQIVNKGNNVYTLQVAHSGKFLTAQDGKVVQASGGTANTQKWRAEWNGTGISLINVSTGKAMEVQGASTSGGAKIISKNAKSSAAGQRFVFVSRDLIDSGMYTMRCLAGSKLLDVAGESKANGAKLDLWSANNGTNQKFNIARISGKYYRIVGVGSNKAVTGNGTQVYQQTYSGADTQLWEAKISPNGGVVFVNKKSGKALNVSGGKSVDGAKIDAQAADLKLAGQRWTVSPTTTLKDYQQQALNKVKARGSSTNWYIVTKLGNHRLMVFHRDSASSFWYLYDEWTIGSGMNYGEYYTPRVDGKVGTKREMDGKDWEGWCAWYWTYWGGQWFHSVLCSYGTKHVLSGPQLGVNVSKGCVRNPFDKAKWIYDNIPKGTSVTVWD